jgi:hypothetical protein
MQASVENTRGREEGAYVDDESQGVQIGSGEKSVCLSYQSVLYPARGQQETYIVEKGANNTASSSAVPCVLDTATSAKRTIIRIDEVVWIREGACSCIPVAVCPGSRICKVGSRCIPQDVLAELFCARSHKVLRNKGNCLMCHSSPGMGALKERANRKEGRQAALEFHDSCR